MYKYKIKQYSTFNIVKFIFTADNTFKIIKYINSLFKQIKRFVDSRNVIDCVLFILETCVISEVMC